MTLPTTSMYLIVFALMNFALAFASGATRGKKGISVGDGGDPELTLAMRRHMNFLEFVPMMLILLLALELNGASAAWLHGLGGSLVVARIAHAVGIRLEPMNHPLRFVGAAGTALITFVTVGKLVSQVLAA